MGVIRDQGDARIAEDPNRLEGLEQAVEANDRQDADELRDRLRATAEAAAATEPLPPAPGPLDGGEAQPGQTTSSTRGSEPTRPLSEGRVYVVLRRHSDPSRDDSSVRLERLGTVTAPTREGAWEQVQHEPDAWLGDATHLGLGEIVELGLMPESAWPEFRKLGTRPRLEVV